MTLRLKALTANEPGFAGQERALDGPSLTIGRSPDNDWPLRDEERQISKTHCRIESRNDRSELIDLSSNGVFFEGDEAPLGLGVRRQLKAGDVFLIGGYRFLVTKDAPATAPAPTMNATDGSMTISQILGGSSEATETRASSAMSGEAPRWFGDVPKGAADEILQTPFGWDAPPRTSEPALPADDPIDFASSFSDASEHIPAIGSTLRVPEVRTVLPDDWLVAPEEPASARGSAPSAATTQADAQAHRKLLDAAGLTPAQLSDKLPDAVLGHCGALLGSFMEGLHRLSSALERVEADLGLSGTPLSARLPLGGAADLLDPDGGGDAAVRNEMDILAKRLRDLGEAVRAGATDVGNHLRPEGIERRARAGMILPVWPIHRQACWNQYVLDFAALGRTGGAGPADVVLGPVRAAFDRISQRASDAVQ